MAITARLSHKLHQTLGDEAPEDLVNWMQQVDAHRAELRELNELNFARIDARLADVAMRTDLAELRRTTQSDLAQLRQEMKAGFAEMREEMRAGLADVRQEMARLEARLERRIGDLIKWSFVFWVGAVGAIAILAGVLR